MGIEKWQFVAEKWNVSEVGQDRATVSSDCLYKVAYELSIANKIDDLE